MRIAGTIDLKISVLLLLLLVILASLQYRWTAELSRAERERLQASLERSAAHLCDDFDREIGRVFAHFLREPSAFPSSIEDDYAKRFHTWTEEAPYPDILGELFLAKSSDGGAVLLRLEPQSDRWAQVDWPPDLRSLREALSRDGAPVSPTMADLPTVLLPVPAPHRGSHRERGEWAGMLVLRLNLDFIRTEFLPELAQRHFKGEWADYVLAVFDRRDPSNAIYRSDPNTSLAFFDSPDVSADLLSLRWNRGWNPPPVRSGARFAREPRRRSPFPDPDRSGAWGPGRGARGGAWQLKVRNRAGSLDAAVARFRTRSLAVSFGILALLGGSIVMVIVSTHRARQLARQQIDFMAGMSHELRTPLSVIRSAAQNLADRTIDDREQVVQYGALIEKEGRRLSEMVDQVLDYAAFRSDGSRPLRRASVDQVIDSALRAARPLLEQEGVEVQKRIPDGLPLVKGDASSLSQAFQNLIVNAIKYGGEARFVEVTAERSPSTSEIAITVSDRGDGIESGDLPHIFEPFYRARKTSLGRIPGSGLGLSVVKRIVQAHGGRIAVDTHPGCGSSFTVHLAAEAPEGALADGRPDSPETIGPGAAEARRHEPV